MLFAVAGENATDAPAILAHGLHVPQVQSPGTRPVRIGLLPDSLLPNPIQRVGDEPIHIRHVMRHGVPVVQQNRLEGAVASQLRRESETVVLQMTILIDARRAGIQVLDPVDGVEVGQHRTSGNGEAPAAELPAHDGLDVFVGGRLLAQHVLWRQDRTDRQFGERKRSSEEPVAHVDLLECSHGTPEPTARAEQRSQGQRACGPAVSGDAVEGGRAEKLRLRYSPALGRVHEWIQQRIIEGDGHATHAEVS